ncbi:hypothetical protein Nepgr_006051 [Nepenthes gracilis]|uniref:Uncharacterized protein n=1 Tax=Nepenthes gracilis TaxID=150966 RepID=A0AAD3XH07_NEPGR|nr:hypothetical protein Nepgr_006051 [Nepenthes gracilis]
MGNFKSDGVQLVVGDSKNDVAQYKAEVASDFRVMEDGSDDGFPCCGSVSGMRNAKLDPDGENLAASSARAKGMIMEEQGISCLASAISEGPKMCCSFVRAILRIVVGAIFGNS